MPLDRERRLPPLVGDEVGIEALCGQIPRDARIREGGAVLPGALPHESRRQSPVVVEIDPERCAATVCIGGVEPLPRLYGRGLAARGRRTEVRQAAVARVADGAGDVVDVAAVALRPADQTDRRAAADGDVHEALGDVATLAAQRVTREIVTGLEGGGIRLVGDDAHRAGLRARAVQRALRTGERLHALDVVDVDVERTLDGRDRLLIQVHADARQRAGVVGVVAAGDSAHVDLGETRAAGLVGDARQELHVVIEVLHPELLQPRGAEGRDTDRHVLEIFGALLGRHHDLFEASGAAGLGGIQTWYRRHDGGGYRRAPQQYARAQVAAPLVSNAQSLQ